MVIKVFFSDLASISFWSDLIWKSGTLDKTRKKLNFFVSLTFANAVVIALSFATIWLFLQVLPGSKTCRYKRTSLAKPSWISKSSATKKNIQWISTSSIHLLCAENGSKIKQKSKEKGICVFSFCAKPSWKVWIQKVQWMIHFLNTHFMHRKYIG